MHWIGLLQCVTAATAVTLTLHRVFGYAWKRGRRTVWIALLIAAAAGAGVMLSSRAEPDAADLIREALILVCAIVFPYALLRFNRKRTFLLFGLAYCATTDYIVSVIPTAHTAFAYILLDVLIGVSALIACKANRKAPPGFPDQVSVWIYIAVFTADLSAYYGGMLHQDTTYYAGVSVALKAVSLVLICISILLLVRRYLAIQRAERTALEQLAMQLRHYDDLVEKNRRVRALRHDYENNLLSIGAILDAGQTEDARDYVRRLQGEVHAAAYTYATGNYFADAILSDKASAAEEKGIRISFGGTVPEKGIANPDLCTILCNLLDNAVQGSVLCAPCAVDLDGRETADRWLLQVKNPVAHKVDVRGGVIRTSKADKENHGLGLANVRRAAERYDGYLELKCDDHCFTAEVGLMLKSEVTE